MQESRRRDQAILSCGCLPCINFNLSVICFLQHLHAILQPSLWATSTSGHSTHQQRHATATCTSRAAASFFFFLFLLVCFLYFFFFFVFFFFFFLFFFLLYYYSSSFSSSSCWSFSCYSYSSPSSPSLSSSSSSSSSSTQECHSQQQAWPAGTQQHTDTMATHAKVIQDDADHGVSDRY